MSGLKGTRQARELMDQVRAHRGGAQPEGSAPSEAEAAARFMQKRIRGNTENEGNDGED